MVIISLGVAGLAAANGVAEASYSDLCGYNIMLDMTRGKPSLDQLDLSNDLLTVVSPENYLGQED